MVSNPYTFGRNAAQNAYSYIDPFDKESVSRRLADKLSNEAQDLYNSASQWYGSKPMHGTPIPGTEKTNLRMRGGVPISQYTPSLTDDINQIPPALANLAREVYNNPKQAATNYYNANIQPNVNTMKSGSKQIIPNLNKGIDNRNNIANIIGAAGATAFAASDFYPGNPKAITKAVVNTAKKTNPWFVPEPTVNKQSDVNIESAQNFEKMKIDRDKELQIAESKVAGGSFDGAPNTVNNLIDEDAAIDKYLSNASESVEFSDWYDESGLANMFHMGDDPTKASQFTGALARTSASTPVDQNLGYAIRGNNQIMAGNSASTGRFPVEMGKSIDSYYAADNPASVFDAIGPKIGPFAESIAKGGEFELTSMNRAVHDIWDGRAWGYQNADGSAWDQGFSAEQHAWMDKAMTKAVNKANTQKLSGKNNWDERSLQAAVWITAKAKKENIPIAEAGKNYKDLMAKYYGQGSYESVPGKTTTHMAELKDAPLQVRQDHLNETFNIMNDEKGRDRLSLAFGLPTGQTIKGPGVFEGEINPGAQTQVALGRATGGKNIDQSSADLINAVEASRGLALGQDAAVSHLAGNPKQSLKSSNAFDFDVDGYSNDMAMHVTNEITKKFGPDALNDLNPIATNDGFRILSFPKAAYDGNPKSNFVGPMMEEKAFNGVTNDEIISEVGAFNPKTKIGQDFAAATKPVKRAMLIQKAVDYRATNVAKFSKKLAKDLGVPEPMIKRQLQGQNAYIGNDWTKNPLGQVYVERINRPEFVTAFDNAVPEIMYNLNKADQNLGGVFGEVKKSDVTNVRNLVIKGGFQALKDAINNKKLSVPTIGAILALVSMDQDDMGDRQATQAAQSPSSF